VRGWRGVGVRGVVCVSEGGLVGVMGEERREGEGGSRKVS